MEDRWGRLDRKGKEKAKKIGKVAARLFSRKGYLETTMDEIATAARISKGGMYYYFPSKSEVLFFILSNYMDQVLGNLEQEIDRIEHGNEKLKYIISRHIELYSNHLPEAKVLLHDAHCLPAKYFKIIAEKERKYYQMVVEVLPDLFNKSISKGQLTAITFILFGMCNWIYSWYNPKGSITPRELSEIIYNIFLKGVQNFQS
jgi:AcrR family transcriptional regulator